MRRFTTRELTYMAVLAALEVVLARFVIPMPEVTVRFSIEAVPIILAGLLFGPVPGMLVGFVGDFVGAQFSGYGYNPVFALPPVLIGLCAGLLRHPVIRRQNIWRIILSFLPAVVLGSVLWQSHWLSVFYGMTNTLERFRDWPVVKFLVDALGVSVATACQIAMRSIQFAVTTVINALIILGMFKTGMFASLGLWPPRTADGTGHSSASANKAGERS